MRTDPDVAASQISEWVVVRWQVDLSLKKRWAYLGVETQRHWLDRAISRTTPLVLSIFSLVTLLAHQFLQGTEMPIRTAAWYGSKCLPICSDTLAFVR